MAIELTESAASHILNYANANKKPFVGVRLSVRPSGCSGLAYDLEYAEKIEKEDFTFDSNGVTVVVDPKSLIHVDGTVMDYVREGVQEGFRFSNPNATSVCGCGESFHT